jgi:small subunit ribosomal protein S9
MTSKATSTKPAAMKARYYEGIGGRKTAVARVRLYKEKGHMTVNDESVKYYFMNPMHQGVALAPLTLTSMLDHSAVSVHVRGGGIAAQADAVRHGIARALVAMDAGYKKVLRASGFLTRDPRSVERKKPGLKKARKGPQWAKR